MLLSVLVRSCNDETQIAGSLAAIFSQRTEDEVEVIVCDDGSTDGTRGVLAGLGGRIRLLPRPPGPYFPGRTLNALVRAARGEIAVFNNADAVPLDERWLEGLVAPLKAGAADATFANQLPRADATALVRRDYLRAFGDGQAAATWPRFFSLASAAARRADLLAHPFDETLHYSEDVEWAYRRPIRRVYVPTARVEHSHNYTMAELRRRFYGEGYADAQVFGDPPPGVVTAACAALRAAARDVAWLARSPACLRELPSALPRRLVQQFAARAGKADARAGRPPRTVSTACPAAAGEGDVLFVGEVVGFAGGIEQYAFDAAARLRAQGVAVDYLGTRRARDAARFAAGFRRVVASDPGGYARVVLHKIPSLKAVRELKRRYGERLEVVVHDHDLYCPRRHYYTPWGRANCTRAYAPLRCLACALATSPTNWPRLLAARAGARLLALRDGRATVLSAFMKANLVKNGFAAARVTVAPPEIGRTGQAARREASGARPLRILFLGQLVAGKGVDLLIAAVARLKRPYRLVIAGEGNARRRLEAQAKGVANGEIVFRGWVADRDALFADADVLAFPSRWQEPYGLAGAEARACGLPVVAFDVGGVRQWADGGCRLVPAGDVAAFAQALEEVA